MCLCRNYYACLHWSFGIDFFPLLSLIAMPLIIYIQVHSVAYGNRLRKSMGAGSTWCALKAVEAIVCLDALVLLFLVTPSAFFHMLEDIYYQ